MKNKFVSPLTEQTKKALDEFIEKSKNAREIKRVNAILLSSKNITINTISSIYEVDRDTVSRWINLWNKLEIKCLEDKKHTGRKPKLTKLQQIETIQIVKSEPRKLKLAVVEIKKRFGKDVSIKTIKRILKKKVLGGKE
jgi:transposase